MEDAQFWTIIESGGPQALDDPDAQRTAVRAQLRRLAPEQILKFSRLFDLKLDRLYA